MRGISNMQFYPFLDRHTALTYIANYLMFSSKLVEQVFEVGPHPGGVPSQVFLLYDV